MNERFLKAFLIVNIVVLAGFFVWGYVLPLFHMGADMSKMGEFVKEPPPLKIENPAPAEVGENLTDSIRYTINATNVENWVFFDFSSGTSVPGAKWDSTDWDLAFRRAKILVNGGVTNPGGQGGVAAVPGKDLGALAEAPESGYSRNERPTGAGEASNPNIDKWYNYNYWTHKLTPKEQVYALRTADGKYAKFVIEDYYCGEGVSGCLAFRYVYQGNGSRSFIKPAGGNAVHAAKAPTPPSGG